MCQPAMGDGITNAWMQSHPRMHAIARTSPSASNMAYSRSPSNPGRGKTLRKVLISMPYPAASLHELRSAHQVTLNAHQSMPQYHGMRSRCGLKPDLPPAVCPRPRCRRGLPGSLPLSQHARLRERPLKSAKVDRRTMSS